MNTLKTLALALFVAGLCASYALAGNGHGKGHAVDSTTSTGSTTDQTTTTGAEGHHQGKVTLCHRAGKSGRYVKIAVAAKAAKSRLRHGDVAPSADGTCPAPATPTTTGTTTTDETTTTTP
jgi:hypothetical protein